MAKIANGGSCCLSPQAFISVNKNRQKIYDKNGEQTIYLPNQTQFEIELFNPTQKRVGVKFYFNGVSNSNLLIIRPGERMFLDRHLSDNKKLLFDVYDVSGNNSEVEKAIQKNGNIKIEFYNEKEQCCVTKTSTIYVREPYYVPYVPTYPAGPIWVGTSTPRYATCYHNSTLGGINGSSTITTANINYSTTTSASGEVCLDSLDDFSSTPSLNYCSKSIETGRVEMGDESKQKFVNTTFDEEYSPSTTVEYKLLPISQKNLTNDDLNKSKMFCCQCGAKVKKSDKFCFQCGAKL